MPELESPPRDGDHEWDGHPKGTLVLLLAFLASIVVMWGYIYFLMIQRG